MDLTPIPYITDHSINRTVMAAVAAGLRKEARPAEPASWVPHPAISYGVLRGTADIFRRCHYAQIDWYHLDLGYWDRGHFDGYYRLNINGTQEPVLTGDRPRIPLPEIDDWQPGTGPIVVCPPTWLFSSNQPLDILDSGMWTKSTIATLKTVTDRPIEVRQKAEAQTTPFPSDPWCIVTYNSNIAVDGMIRGTPSISTGPGIMRDLGPLLEEIEDPIELRSIDRNNALAALSWGQFTLDELRAGLPWSLMDDY